MPDERPTDEPRILITAIQEMDRLARRFRRRLRKVAMELSKDAGRTGPIGPDLVAEAARLLCRESLSDTDTDSSDDRGSDGQRPRAA